MSSQGRWIDWICHSSYHFGKKARAKGWRRCPWALSRLASQVQLPGPVPQQSRTAWTVDQHSNLERSIAQPCLHLSSNHSSCGWRQWFGILQSQINFQTPTATRSENIPCKACWWEPESKTAKRISDHKRTLAQSLQNVCTISYHHLSSIIYVPICIVNPCTVSSFSPSNRKSSCISEVWWLPTANLSAKSPAHQPRRLLWHHHSRFWCLIKKGQALAGVCQVLRHWPLCCSMKKHVFAQIMRLLSLGPIFMVKRPKRHAAKLGSLPCTLGEELLDSVAANIIYI